MSFNLINGKIFAGQKHNLATRKKKISLERMKTKYIFIIMNAKVDGK